MLAERQLRITHTHRSTQPMNFNGWKPKNGFFRWSSFPDVHWLSTIGFHWFSCVFRFRLAMSLARARLGQWYCHFSGTLYGQCGSFTQATIPQWDEVTALGRVRVESCRIYTPLWGAVLRTTRQNKNIQNLSCDRNGKKSLIDLT